MNQLYLMFLISLKEMDKTEHQQVTDEPNHFQGRLISVYNKVEILTFTS